MNIQNLRISSNLGRNYIFFLKNVILLRFLRNIIKLCKIVSPPSFKITAICWVIWYRYFIVINSRWVRSIRQKKLAIRGHKMRQSPNFRRKIDFVTSSNWPHWSYRPEISPKYPQFYTLFII